MKNAMLCDILFMVDYNRIQESYFMIYNYNRLWKLLIDKGMTKTQMRLQAGISTNILAKMGRGESIAMESLVKIAIALNCGLDDIVEIQKGNRL